MPTTLKSRMMATRPNRHALEHAEIQDDDDGDENLEDGQERALREQIGLAGLVDQLGDLAHRAVHRQVLQLVEDDQAEEDAERGDAEADHEQRAALIAADRHQAQIGKNQIGFSAAPLAFRRGACAAGAAGSGCCAQAAAGAISAVTSDDRQRDHRTTHTAESFERLGHHSLSSSRYVSVGLAAVARCVPGLAFDPTGQ